MTTVIIESGCGGYMWQQCQQTSTGVNQARGICQPDHGVCQQCCQQPNISQGNTFTNINNMITGGVTNVNLATQAFGNDLDNLGRLINLQI
jgi:hypothetical protein